MPADLVAILDTLRLHLLSLSRTDPYYGSRVRRISQQLDYVVQAWPSDEWPLSPPQPTQPLAWQTRLLVPTQAQVRRQLRELQETLQEEEPTSACQQQLLDLLLCLL